MRALEAVSELVTVSHDYCVRKIKKKYPTLRLRSDLRHYV
jgi:hypothetical protein